jgi:UDP-N-acetyl-D-galactosamine dehydrogenase
MVIKNQKSINICILGLGYVGLPLALEFAKKYQVIGYDKSKRRIDKLKKNIDCNNEFSKKELSNKSDLLYTNNLREIEKSNIYIVTVPTPIKKNKLPDLSYLRSACADIGNVLDKNNYVIFESTVFPGATEEICIPILEKVSKLKLNKDFYCGYSPERINPGDKKHTLVDIIKITSGSNTKSSNFIDRLYRDIIKAGTYKASSIKIAEAAKVIENTQRDLNIAFVNELSIIFNKLNINTKEVLKAASTKWNFTNYKPGLVGGHCIGVDPYYLTYKAKKEGINPKIILSGREINDQMFKFIYKQIENQINKKNIKIKKPKVLIMGFSFKENCSDIRNTQVFNLYQLLRDKNFLIDIFDPISNKFDSKKVYNVELIRDLKKEYYDIILLLVGHDVFKKMGVKKIKSFAKKNSVFYDLHGLFDLKESDLYL